MKLCVKRRPQTDERVSTWDVRKEREEVKKQISGTERLIRTEDRSGFRTTAVSLPRTAADACENQSSVDAWTPPDLEHTP